MKTCPNCKAELPDDLKFCPHCAQKLPGSPPGKKPAVLWAVLAVLAVLCVVLAVLLLRQGEKSAPSSVAPSSVAVSSAGTAPAVSEAADSSSQSLYPYDLYDAFWKKFDEIPALREHEGCNGGYSQERGIYAYTLPAGVSIDADSNGVIVSIYWMPQRGSLDNEQWLFHGVTASDTQQSIVDKLGQPYSQDAYSLIYIHEEGYYEGYSFDADGRLTELKVFDASMMM